VTAWWGGTELLVVILVVTAGRGDAAGRCGARSVKVLSWSPVSNKVSNANPSAIRHCRPRPVSICAP
jgi:hypothetical protein